MDGNQILLLGLGIEAPWKLVDQRLDTDKQPHELHLTIKAERVRIPRQRDRRFQPNVTGHSDGS